VFSTRWIGQGPKVNEFEHEFGKKFGFEYSVSTNSGTSALELAFHLADLNEGDEVLVTCLTCSATSIPLVRRKCKIVFVDINPETLTLNYDDMVSKVTEKTKAVITVNLGGIQCDQRIYDFLKENEITSIIDCCQSLGIPETNGDYLAYSFQAIKHFSTFDGGMLITRNKEDYDRAKRLRWFGIDRECKIKNDWKCYDSNREICMDMSEAGYKFHMNDVAASIGLIGLKHSDTILAHRKQIAQIYKDNLKVPYITGGSHWLFCIMIDNRFKLIQQLKEKGIEVDVAQLRNDVFTVFGGRWTLPNMDKIESKYLYIPMNTKVSIDDAKYVADTINEVI
jgi:perosamine synthetase